MDRIQDVWGVVLLLVLMHCILSGPRSVSRLPDFRAHHASFCSPAFWTLLKVPVPDMNPTENLWGIVKRTMLDAEFGNNADLSFHNSEHHWWFWWLWTKQSCIQLSSPFIFIVLLAYKIISLSLQLPLLRGHSFLEWTKLGWLNTYFTKTFIQ